MAAAASPRARTSATAARRIARMVSLAFAPPPRCGSVPEAGDSHGRAASGRGQTAPAVGHGGARPGDLDLPLDLAAGSDGGAHVADGVRLRAVARGLGLP